jgi:hypothetical protein
MLLPTSDAPEIFFHEVATLFPPMDEEEFRLFAADVAQRGLIEPIWTFQGAFPADGIPEEDREKIDDLVVPETPPRKAHTLTDLTQDAVFAKMRRYQHHFPKPGRRRGNGLGRGLDDHHIIGDTGHMYLLEEMNCVFPSQ